MSLSGVSVFHGHDEQHRKRCLDQRSFAKQLEATELVVEKPIQKKLVPPCAVIWQCVKTNSTPVAHIKIAGIYGCSSP